MALTFGRAADELGSQLEDVDVIVASEEAVGRAYFEFAERLQRGERSLGMLLIEDKRWFVGVMVARQMALDRIPYDVQRVNLDLLAAGSLLINGASLADATVKDAAVMSAMRDLYRMCDALIVRSFTEYERLRTWFSAEKAEVERWFPKRDVGNWERRTTTRQKIVIWAPDQFAESTAIFTTSLHGVHAEIFVVCGGGSAVSMNATYLVHTDPQIPDILANATCIIDASPVDPSWAYALAERGCSLAVSDSSGAKEWVRGAAVYSLLNHRSIHAATMSALAVERNGVRAARPTASDLRDTLERTKPAYPATQPLVSIIMPTFNRPDIVRRTLHSFREQRYEHFEIILVNDGGTERVPELADIDPRIRLFDRTENVGVNRACNFGFLQARGKYIQLLADDDRLYPDHFVRLVGALERTGFMVANSNALMRYERLDPAGNWETYGVNAAIFAFSLEPTEAQASSPVAGQALFMRRDALEAIGGLFNADLVLSDQELQIRLIDRFDFVHVEHFTVEWLIRDGDHNMSSKKENDVPAELERMWALHPGGPYVTDLREATLKNVRSRPPRYIFPPAISRPPRSPQPPPS